MHPVPICDSQSAVKRTHLSSDSQSAIKTQLSCDSQSALNTYVAKVLNESANK